jgi:hypothetical protein
MFDLMKVGSTKTFEVSDNIAYDGKMSVRIIGLCQDVKEDDTVAGLTFQATHALKEPMQMQRFKYGINGWKKSRVRK